MASVELLARVQAGIQRLVSATTTCRWTMFFDWSWYEYDVRDWKISTWMIGDRNNKQLQDNQWWCTSCRNKNSITKYKMAASSHAPIAKDSLTSGTASTLRENSSISWDWTLSLLRKPNLKKAVSLLDSRDNVYSLVYWLDHSRKKYNHGLCPLCT